jgi:hypothetical protein
MKILLNFVTWLEYQLLYLYLSLRKKLRKWRGEMAVTNRIIEGVLSYFGVSEKEADIIKNTIELFDLEENEKEITISCKKGFTLKIDK